MRVGRMERIGIGGFEKVDGRKMGEDEWRG